MVPISVFQDATSHGSTVAELSALASYTPGRPGRNETDLREEKVHSGPQERELVRSILVMTPGPPGPKQQ